MSLNKKGYFQGGGGVNEPAPGEKKYKSEPALVVQPRFKEPFYRNYDLYTIPGMEEIGPGTGYHGLQGYNSVQEFLAARRGRMKGRYVADDSWQLDSGKRTKENPGIKVRAAIFEKIIKTAGPNYDLGKGLYQEMSDGKVDSVEEFREEGNHGPAVLMNLKSKKKDINHIDFPIDDQISIIDLEEGVLPGTQIGERLPLSEHDLSGHSPEALNFGRDDHDEIKPGRDHHEDILQKLFNKYLSSSETGLFGLPDGVDSEGHDADQTQQIEDPFTGISDIGTNMYDDK